MRLLKIGRNSSCDIVINNPRVSSLHAEIILLNNGDILLEDKQSKNGTYVMNHPIKPNTQVNIKRGDAIRFADTELRWEEIPYPEDLSNFKAVYGIGTNFRNEIQIIGNTVSRFHATLKIDKRGHSTLQDHSKNGTTVNGRKINFGQSVKISKKDSVICGGVPVNLSSYIEGSHMWYAVGTAAVAVVITLLVWLLPWSGTVSPSNQLAMENGVSCVYGGFYYKIQYADDPFRQIKGWPQEWYIGFNNNGNLEFTDNKNQLSPIYYNGTAFFISKDGELGTNRHVALPWEYRDKGTEESILQIANKVRYRNVNSNSPLLRYIMAFINADIISEEDALIWLERFQKSEIKISGVHEYLGVGLRGTKITNIRDLHNCQVIAESNDPKKDVALLRLNSRKTPEYIVEQEAIYNIEKARLDERSLEPQKEELLIIGYPGGEKISNENFDGKELRPTIHKTTLSMSPDDNRMQVQTIGIGGQSGSPVIDSNHRLVGVLCSGFSAIEVTYCCNIKHLKELYDKNRVRQ